GSPSAPAATVPPVPPTAIAQVQATPTPEDLSTVAPTVAVEATPVPATTPSPEINRDLAGARAVVTNTDGVGVRYRAECADATGSAGWPDRTEVVIEYWRSDCPEWFLVRGPDSRLSWVRARYLARASEATATQAATEAAVAVAPSAVPPAATSASTSPSE